MPSQDFEDQVAAQLASEAGPPPAAPPPAAAPSWNPLAELLRRLTPEWATEPTPEQVEAKRQQDERIKWTQEAEHATATPLQRLLQNIGNTGMGTVEGLVGASDELYSPPRAASGQPIPLTPQRLGNLLGEAGPDLVPGIGAVGSAMSALPVGKVLQRLLKGGLYSRVEDVARQIPPKGINPQRLASQLKSGASSEEMAVRQVPEFLARHGNTPVTPEAVEAHLAANPAPFPQVVTRGDSPPALVERQQAKSHEASAAFDRAFPSTTTHGQPWPGDRLSQLDDANARHWSWQAAGGDAEAMEKLNRLAISPERREAMLEYGRLANETRALNEQGLSAKPKFAQYQLPGGENYQERLLTLPGTERPRVAALRAEIEQLTELPSAVTTYKGEDRTAAFDRLSKEFFAAGGTHERPKGFTEGHWDEPNVLVHVRHNDRTLPTGERGRFLEEVQSDWHQKGKEQGYKSPGARVATKAVKQDNGVWEVTDQDGRFLTNVLPGAMPADGTDTAADALEMAQRRLRPGNEHQVANDDRVPDAPFKENWPDLALKQQLAEVADDPNISWLGFTDGKTQADRYSLSKQVKAVHWYPERRELEVIEHGNSLPTTLASDIGPEKLADYIGKEAARNLVEAPVMGGAHVMTGLDLDVGGTGMKKFYDELLPKRLEKLVKPFGGKVERLPLGSRSQEMIDAEMDALHAADLTDEQLRQGLNRLQHERNGAVAAPAWVVRLTPEMKAKIKAAGLPLMAAPLAVAASGEQEPQQ